MRRPLSHVYAVFVFTLFIALKAMQLLHGGRDVVSIVLMALCAIQLLGMFVAPRDRRQYVLGTLLLTLIALDALYDLAIYPGYQLAHHLPGARLTWPMVAVNGLAGAAVFFLAWDFAMGRASRAFFDKPKK